MSISAKWHALTCQKLLQGDMTQVQTARYLGVSQSVIRNLLTHLFTNWHDARWTLKQTSMDNITCAILLPAYCFIKHHTALAVIKKWNKIINTNSAQLTHDAGLRAQQPYVGLPFTGRHWQARLVWAKQHQCWTNQMWGTILFTGESHFLVDVLDRQRQVWHQLEERLARCAVGEHNRYWGGIVMVWGGNSLWSCTDLVVIHGTFTRQHYIDLILQTHMFYYSLNIILVSHYKMIKPDLTVRELCSNFFSRIMSVAWDGLLDRHVPNRACWGYS